ncbi:putative iron-sulfur cluster-binding metallochaperone [Cycloclasticus zancles]|uniref:Copper chaperone n=1 Tax=Cycloclasticus zancles 78-ME TaxID=1198232 RepID=S5TCL3_9GAMM|nr:copper chaperone [Cycloclasticus zancles]AGS38547.1 Copper chaperone [Cycloclasticus zancles 78-ME]AGS40820.1 Copper chaperone [Cycloclasticus zancles 78-ME]
MSDCCSSKRPPRKAECPDCRQVQKATTRQTLLHHVISPVNRSIPESHFYFCANADCETVYFSDCGCLYRQDQVRGAIGQKQTSTERTICYCFDVTERHVLDELEHTGHSASKSFVTAQTKAKLCACETQNPSGQCCLADFSLLLKKAMKNGI